MTEVREEIKDTTLQENGLEEFAELMQEVAELTQEQQEKVTLFVQGFIAAHSGYREKPKSKIA